MGDSGEGLIDAESKIQERMDEMKANREQAKKPSRGDPEQMRQLDSLKLARTQLTRQLEGATHEGRRKQITDAITRASIFASPKMGTKITKKVFDPRFATVMIVLAVVASLSLAQAPQRRPAGVTPAAWPRSGRSPNGVDGDGMGGRHGDSTKLLGGRSKPPVVAGLNAPATTVSFVPYVKRQYHSDEWHRYAGALADVEHAADLEGTSGKHAERPDTAGWIATDQLRGSVSRSRRPRYRSRASLHD